MNEAVDVVLGNVTATALRQVGPSPDVAAVQRLLTGSDDLDDDIVLAVLGADERVERESGAAVVEVDGRDLVVAAGQSGSATHLGGTRPARPTAYGSSRSLRGRVLRCSSPGRWPVPGRSSGCSRWPSPSSASSRWLPPASPAGGWPGRGSHRCAGSPPRSSSVRPGTTCAPVPVASDDEIGRLGVAFNHLLDTVQVSRTRQARFVADAGHELRTPLTSLRTNIELLTVDADRAILRPEDRLTIMRDVRAQLMEFSALVSDLIGLTREDRRRPTSPTST